MEAVQTAIATAKQNEKSRGALLATLRAEILDLETPHEVFWRMLVEPHAYAVVRSGIQLGLFRLLHVEGTVSAEKIAQRTGADKLLVVRLMRVLGAMGIVKEMDVETYTNGPGGKVLAEDAGMSGALSFMSVTQTHTVLRSKHSKFEEVTWHHKVPNN
jgi:hypothetical protein